MKLHEIAEGIEALPGMTCLVDLPVFAQPNTSKVAITGDGRITAVVSVRGINIPYYLSTGEGGKLSVATGKWYPFFGTSSAGWINKGSESSINVFYGSKTLERYAGFLNRQLGNLITIQKQIPPMQKGGRNIINKDVEPMEKGQVETNPNEFKRRVNAFLAKIGDKPHYSGNTEAKQ